MTNASEAMSWSASPSSPSRYTTLSFESGSAVGPGTKPTSSAPVAALVGWSTAYPFHSSVSAPASAATLRASASTAGPYTPPSLSAPVPTRTAPAFGGGERRGERRRAVGEGLERVGGLAELGDVVSEVGLLADARDGTPPLIDMRRRRDVEERRLDARVGADEEEGVGVLDPDERRVERVPGAQVGREAGARLGGGRAEHVEQLLRARQRLDRDERAREGADRAAGGADAAGGGLERLGPADGRELAVLPEEGRVEPLLFEAWRGGGGRGGRMSGRRRRGRARGTRGGGPEGAAVGPRGRGAHVDGVARLVRDPLLVDELVRARLDAHHLAGAGVDLDVRAAAVEHVDRGGGAELPRAGGEGVPAAERAEGRGSARGGGGGVRGEGAEGKGGGGGGRAGAHGLFVRAPTGQRSMTLPDISVSSVALDVRADLHRVAAADAPQHRDAGDLLGEAHAARAVDAPRHHGLHERAVVLVLGRALHLAVARAVGAVQHRLVLQVALAPLVADRAVERVVGEEILHHPLARLLHHRRVGVDLHPRHRREGARGHRLRRLLDLDQAHPAVPRHRQPLVEAEARHVDADRLARLQHRRALLDHDGRPVDDDLDRAHALARRHRNSSPRRCTGERLRQLCEPLLRPSARRRRQRERRRRADERLRAPAASGAHARRRGVP